MWGLENINHIEKIEAVFFKIGKSFSFVPFIMHSHCVHNLCLLVKEENSFSILPSSMLSLRGFSFQIQGIGIQEWVDRFKLDVGQSRLDENRCMLGIKIRFQVAHADDDLLRLQQHEPGLTKI